MKTAEAFRVAADRVRLIPLACGQYQVNTWSPRHNADKLTKEPTP